MHVSNDEDVSWNAEPSASFSATRRYHEEGVLTALNVVGDERGCCKLSFQSCVKRGYTNKGPDALALVNAGRPGLLR